MVFEDIVLKCILQVRKECNFFAALMMFAKIIKSEQTETAATDGINIYVNESFLQSLNSSEQNALLLHEVLHMALLHVSRSGNRDKYLWNVAADIVVNSLISRNTSFSIPEGAFVNPEFDDLSVEEIYEKLIKGLGHSPEDSVINANITKSSIADALKVVNLRKS